MYIMGKNTGDVPLISVIVPVYNTAKYLRRCVDSILSQTYRNIEIILVNDGSTDGESDKICDEYAKADCRIRVIHKENGGPCSAKNAGLDFAKGEYYSIIDSDDEITKEFLKKCTIEYKKIIQIWLSVNIRQ